MENNSLTPSPAPVPEQGTNMPEFTAAPAAPQVPVMPTTSSMPAFGTNQDMTQPVQSQPLPQSPIEYAEAPNPYEQAPAAESVAQEYPATPEPVAEPTSPINQTTIPPIEPVNPTPVADSIRSEISEIIQPEAYETTPAVDMSGLGEISDENPAQAPIQEAPTEQAPFQTVEQLVAEAARQQAMNPTPVPEKKKKPNILLFAIIGGVLLVCGVIVLILLLNQPKAPTTNPNEVPIVVNYGPDTSTPFNELTLSQALEFLEAAKEYKNFFPDGYTDEEDISSLSSDKTNALFYSYEKKSAILADLKTSPLTISYRDKMTKDNVTFDQKDDYATVTLDSEALDCGDTCYGLIFDKKIVNYYNAPAINPATNTQVNIDHIILVKHEKKDIEKYAPLIAAVFMNGKKIYSTEIKTETDTTDFIVNTVEYNNEEEKKGAKRVSTHFVIDNKTGELYYRPDLTDTLVLVEVVDNEDTEPAVK